jgi:FtsP/CotA-like multicopper oxidase with cupredoxin domain
MDRRTFIHVALANLGAFAVGDRFSSAAPILTATAPLDKTTPKPDFPPTQLGTPREIGLLAEPTRLEIPGRGVFEKWLYNGQYPGPEIRAREGERLRLKVTNRLPQGTTVHWHGIPLPNPMDGVPDVTQPPIGTGETFVYEFDVALPGTYMYHSHFGLQPDRGLVGPLIIEEKTAHVAYDREHTVILTDFLSGAPVPLGAAMSGSANAMRMQTPPYVVLLINGRPPEAPAVFDVKRGERARIRLINPSGATIYRLAIGGHFLTVTHTDGRPVEPVRVDALHIAPGERYDVVVDATNPGAWPIVAQPDNDLPPARAILRYTGSNDSTPHGEALPDGLTRGRMLQLGDLRGLAIPTLRKPVRTFTLALSGGMNGPGNNMGQVWMMNSQVYPNSAPLEVHQGEPVRLRFINQTAMPHPIHMHGHFFRVANVAKDTVIVWANMDHVDLDFVPNNPGAWFLHCHNLYHMEAGMARLIRYV